MEEPFSFEKWIIQHFKPCCYVYSTELAKKIINKNNLSPSEFLRPFGDFNGKSLSVCIKDKMTTIKDFIVDFFDCNSKESCSSLDNNLYSEYINNVFSNPKIYPDWSIHDYKLFKDNKEASYNKLYNNNYPWYNEYEETLIEMLQFSPNEFFKQPLLNIYFCSCKDVPENIDLLIQNNIPSYIEKGIYNNATNNLVIILNDKSDKENIELKPQLRLSIFQGHFWTFNTILWDINTLTHTQGTYKNIWSNYLHKIDKHNPKNNINPNDDIVYGKYITFEEHKKYKKDIFKIFLDYVSKSISSEISIHELFIKEWRGGGWFSKVDNSNEYIKELKLYKLTEIEKKKVSLAIYYFFFRDYNATITTIKKIDFKGKVYQKSANCINQLLTICQFLVSKAKMYKNDIEKSFAVFIENNQYLHALRAQLIIIRMYESLGSYDDLLNFLLNTLNFFQKQQLNEPTYKIIIKWLYPMLYEKMANTYLLKNNSKRKFCLYMYYAADKYYSISDSQNSIQHKYSIYSLGFLYNIMNNVSSSYPSLKQYLNHKMSKLSRVTNLPEEAYNFYKNSLELFNWTKHLSKGNHNQYPNQADNLKYFLESIENYYNQKTNKLGELSISSFSIPEILNMSVLIIENQDFEIALKANESVNKLPWCVFEPYSCVQLKKRYANLSDHDLIILKTLDKIIKRKTNYSNLNLKRYFKGQVNDRLIISFQINNPLDTSIKITSMKLICDFKSDINQINNNSSALIEEDSERTSSPIEYEIIQLTLLAGTTKTIELSIRPLIPGECIIKGVSINLGPNAEIRHYFNKKKFSKLYSYRKQSYSLNDHGRKSTVSSHNSMLLYNTLELNTRRATITNCKGDLIYESIANSFGLLVTFPQGQYFEMYCHELLYIPVLIENNSNQRIKRFSLFYAYSYKTEKGTSNIRDNIYKEIDLFGDNKRTELLIDFIPQTSTKHTINILVKFEEESRFKQIDIKRFIINIDVKPSIRFAFDEEVISIDTLKKTQKTTKFNLKVFTFIQKDASLKNLEIGTIVCNSNMEISQKQPMDWKQLNDDNKTYNIIQCIYHTDTYFNSNQKKNKCIYQGKSVDSISSEFNDSQPHIQKKINQLISNQIILFNWKASDFEGKIINGIHIYKCKLEKPKLSLPYLQILITNAITFNVKQMKISSEDTIITLNLLFQKRALYEYSDIKWYVFKIHDSNIGFTWFGMKSHLIQNSKESKETEINLTFKFMTKLKGEMNINKICLMLYNNEKQNSIFTMKEVPYPLIVTIE